MAKKDKLEALRRARAGAAITSVIEEPQYKSIYEEVDEETYRKRKRDQLLKEDFIVNDNNNDYVDDDVDESYASEEDNEKENAKKKNVPINKFFKPSKSFVKPKKKVSVSVDDILDDFESTPKRREAIGVRDDLSQVTVLRRRPEKKADVPVKQETEPEDVEMGDSAQDADNSTLAGSAAAAAAAAAAIVPSVKPEVESDSESDDEILTKRQKTFKTMRSVNLQPEPVHEAKPIETSSPVKTEPKQEESDPVLLSSPEKASGLSVAPQDVEKDGKTLMYWTDYAEVDHSLVLFGRVVTHGNTSVSAILQINGICKELFFLPRKEDRESGEPVSAISVHEEIVPLLMDKYGLDSIRAKPETKKYAFELPDVPKEAEYLKVLMPFKTPKHKGLTLPSDLEGDTFSKVFGTATNAFESFVLQRRVLGPGWLELSNVDYKSIVGSSHCSLEMSVAKPEDVAFLGDRLPAPKFNILAIHVQPVFNEKTGRQEVAMVTISEYPQSSLDEITAQAVPQNTVTLLRPVGTMKSSFPVGLAKLAKSKNLALRTFPTEKTLLNCLCALVKRSDADFLVGHGLESTLMDILVHRMSELQVPTWSYFGRRSRRGWPGQLANPNRVKEIFQGRLICDISNELGKSVTLKCQSWDLPEMYSMVCKKKLFAPEMNLNQEQYQEDASALLSALQLSETKCLAASECAFQLQLLPLSRTLTQIAGNAWAHTLGGTRAGRSEFLLLHEFTQNNYIVPDKEYQRPQKTSRKAQYKGGLVLEPEVGLHKSFVVVMDFNSLYPSIIQEYNICFTTIDRDNFNKADDDSDEPVLPEYPGSDVPRGLLPKLLANLVGRRKEVKKLLQDPKINDFQKAQYDIKQLALKLQANSLYGYLGFEKSRFYAKALAMLVTAKGREILMETKKIAESIDLHTIYGDTDSLMIETRTQVYEEALEYAAQFQKVVNAKHTILELGLDNVFKSILLHTKKKYAALNVVKDSRGNFVENLEVKGLDLRRREYSPLTKETSNHILHKILSDQDPEEALSEIYSYLEDLTAQIKEHKLGPERFKINTRLSKDPQNYPGGNSMPPVQVALRLRKQGKMIKAGSVITYIITEGEGSVAERARSLQEVLKPNSGLLPDPAYYLEKQLFNPIERLLQTYPGIDTVRLAGSLGLDGRRFEKNSASQLNKLQPFESTISDEDRYKYASFLELQCGCGHKFRFGGLVASLDYKMSSSGIVCLRCNRTMALLRVTAQLESQIRQNVSKYYAGWLKCTECGLETRQISVYGRKCLAGDCKGVMEYRYNDQELYRQLMYFKTIFDTEKSKTGKLKEIYAVGPHKPEPLNEAVVKVLAEQNKEMYHVCQGVVEKYLNNSARRFVDMGAIFGLV